MQSARRPWAGLLGLSSVCHGSGVVEIVEQNLLARFAGGLLKHRENDGFEETLVFGESGEVVGGEGGFDCMLGGGSDEFQAPDKNAGDAAGSGMDAK